MIGVPSRGTARPPVRFLLVATTLVTAVALLVLAARGGIASGRSWWAAASPDRAGLVTAFAGTRPVAARLSGGFAHAPVTARRGGANASAMDFPAEALAAAAEVEIATRHRDDAEGLALRGAARLLSGDVERGVTLLGDAAAEAPADGEILNDYAAALYERAARQDSAHDLVRALDAADRSLAARPIAEARFNRGLLLEALGMDAAAELSWRAYPAGEADRGWKGEAAERASQAGQRAALSQAARDWDAHARVLLSGPADMTGIAGLLAAPGAYQWAREFLEDDLLAAWGSAWQAGDRARAARLQENARRLADALASGTGQSWSSRMVACIEEASPAQRGRLALGHASYGAGRAATRASRFQEGRDALTRAAGELSEAHSVLALGAQAELAVVAYMARDLQTLRSLLDAASPAAAAGGFDAVRGRLAWLRCLQALAGSDLSSAQRHIDESMQLFARARELESASSASSVAAGVWRSLGDHTRSWRCLADALRTRPAVRLLRRHYALLFNASQFALGDGLLHASLDFQQAAVDAARATGSPAELVEALERRARLWRAIGGAAQARADLDEAARAIPRVADEALRSAFSAWMRAIRAELARDRDPQQARDLLDDGTLAIIARRNAQELPELLFERGAAALAAGDGRDARAAFTRGLDSVEDAWRRLDADEHRLGFFDNVSTIFAAAVDEALQRGAVGEAFQTAERSRGRALAVAMLQRQAPVSLTEVQAALPADVTVLYFASAGPVLRVFVIGRDQVRVAPRGVPWAAVESSLRRWERHLREPGISDRRSPDARALYESLVRPAQPWLRAGGRLVIVPEGLLHRLPFAALVDRTTGRYLVEQFPLTVVPGASVLVASPGRTGRAAERPGPALVIGASGGSADDALPALPAITAEVQAVAAAYPGSRTLNGPDATRAAVLSEAGAYRVFHFAGHAVANELNPRRSRLVLSGRGRADDRDLLATDVVRSAFGRTSLVVLAACRTAGGDLYRSEGPASLARPFLMAGAATVVATLWDVEDAATARLLTRFHQAYAASGDVARSLQTAQVAMIGDSDPADRRPAAWAGVVAIGAGHAAAFQ